MNRGNFSIFLAIIISGIIIAGAIFWTRSDKNLTSPAAPISSDAPSGVSLTGFNSDDYPMLGNPAAPVAMTVFSDFQCHFCKTFSQTIEPLIIEKYVKPGKVKIVYRDFAFLSEESNWAAEAAHCANEQRKYWDYVERLHSVQPGHDQSAFSRDNLKKLAQDLGLDTSQFNQCFDSSKYVRRVKNSFEEGVKVGVKGTPTVFINNQLIDGVQPLSTYEEAIERELK